MADELRVSITADASGVGPAVAQATAAVTSSADAIAAAQAKATAATKALTAAQVELGSAAEAGNAQAAGIIQEYAAASAEAQAAVAGLTAAQAANTASTESNTAAQAADTAVTYNRMEAMGAAKVAMGAATGSMGSMEMGLARLAAGSSTLGPLLEKMVPLAVMAAGAFMLYDLGEALYKAFDMGGDAALEMQGKIADLDESYKSLIDKTSLEADKIEAANAKLEHLPNPNAMKEAIDQAMADADEMASKLDSLIGKEETLIKSQGMSGSGLERFLLNEPSSHQEEVDLTQHQVHMEKAVSLEEQLRESTSFVAVEQAKLNDLTRKQTDLDYVRNNNMAAKLAMDSVGISNFDKEIQRLQLIVAEHQKETVAIQEQIRLRDAQTKHEELTGEGKAPKAPKAATDNLPEQIARASIDGAHAADGQLGAEQQIVAAMDKQIELNDLKAKYSKEGTAAERDTLRVMENQLATAQAKEKIEALGTEQLNKTFEEEQKAAAEAQRRTEEQTRVALEESNRLREQQIQGARETAAALIDAANQEFERTQMEIRGQEELGIISHRVAEQRLLDALKLRESTTQGALKQEQGLFDPALGQKEAIEYQKLEGQMTKEAQRAATERERIVQQEATKMEQIYKRVANEFNTDFTRAFNEWATKSKTAGQAFGAMLGQMELQVINFVEKWILNKAEMWAEDKLLQAQANAQEKATQAASNAATVVGDASVAAATAAAGAAAGGPPAMAAAAAAASEIVMSVGAGALMDTGGMMPHMGFAFNTSGSPERVLSPSQTHNFESMINNGGSRNATLNQTNNFGGGVTKEMLDAHTSQTMSRLRGMLRPEAFA
jgi:hypothetical protein